MLMPAYDQSTQTLQLAHRDGPALFLSLPVFELDGRPSGRYGALVEGGAARLSNGALEWTWSLPFADRPGLVLDLVWRGFEGSPVLRLMMRLRAEAGEHRMTKPAVHAAGQDAGQGAITYFELAGRDLGGYAADLNLGMAGQPELPALVDAGLALAEIQLSHFDPVAHSYQPYRQDYAPAELLPGRTFTGPVALLHSPTGTFLAAYEHGADHPDGFFTFEVTHQGLALRARKGNYPNGRAVVPGQPWESVWFDLAAYPAGLEAFLPVFRRFFLDEVCINPQSRKPYLFYNTWNHQERLKYFHDRPYLTDMNAERMLAEIDVAHKMGIDVFVIDTGWYGKTGDWLVNLERFPEGLQEVKRRLDEYGMKLGLWFNPTVAAITSRPYREHPEWQSTRGGQPLWRGPVWETEESTHMCLASDYAMDFVETMVRLNRELGVCYFKWDAIAQYGCDSPLHNHGSEANSPAERADCYAYELGRAMIKVVEEVSRRCPDVIVDFDVTEGGRFVGLGFLSVGKYFLINNGPYFHDFNIPHSVKIEPDTINVFFYPGPARPRICRQGAKYDPYIPSILFLTHYLPDGPLLAQANSMAALALGGNGWWGDLLALSEEEVAYLGEQADLYKRVAEAATRAYPRVTGFAGSSPEIHEKLDPHTGSGLVAFFTVTPGHMVHYTRPLVTQPREVVGADAWEATEDGRMKLTVDLERDGARVVYFI